MLSDILTDFYPSKVKFTPITDLAFWGSFQDRGNKHDYTLHHLNCTTKKYQEYYEQFKDYINGQRNPNDVSCLNFSSSCCNNNKKLVQENLEFFLEFMKNSYLMSNHFTEETPPTFSKLSIENLTIWKKYNFTYSNSKHNTDNPSNEMTIFCDFVSDLECVATCIFRLEKNNLVNQIKKRVPMSLL